MKQIKLMQGDNILSLKKLPENSIDSIVTDPPYGLSFMGKKWDYDVPSVEFWKEVYRVLKPGGHVLSFGGTRTYHRMVLNMEDAGFEIRDQIMWIYGSGFPKSLNIGKAFDKKKGNEREVVGEVKRLEENGENAPTMKNNHPTLKPINLMNYLCRLITPPGGIVLDPFMGSGSTGISACLEGFRFVGMELDEDYFKIAEARINSYEEYRKLLK